MSVFAVVTLVLLVGLLAWAVSIYNRLVQLRNRIANAFAQIDVQLKRRYDLIPNLVEVAKGYLAHEASTLEAVIQARNQAQGAAAIARNALSSPTAMDQLMGAESALGGALGRLMVLTESYPDLKADATMKSLSEEIASTENRIGFARQAYNDQVLEFNNQVLVFPDVVIANLTGFGTAPMLQTIEKQEERQAPKVQF